MCSGHEYIPVKIVQNYIDRMILDLAIEKLNFRSATNRYCFFYSVANIKNTEKKVFTRE